MDSKAGYNEAYFQEIYNKQNDSRLINDTFSGEDTSVGPQVL